MTSAPPTSRRIVSLDQFRGYTVLGMFLVNFVGGFQACHYVLKHHNTFCSYADTIMPQFLFAVGFAFRLTFNRRVASQGSWTAYFRMVRRLLGLVLVSLVVYTVDRPAETWQQLSQMGVWEVIRVPLKRDWFQTLMHIAVTSLWILPVIRAGVTTRVVFMIASAVAHVILSQQFYFLWVNNGQPNGIDGGPLGFLTWTIPAIVGTLACDIVNASHQRPPLLRLIRLVGRPDGTGLFLFLRDAVLRCPCGTRGKRSPRETGEPTSLATGRRPECRAGEDSLGGLGPVVGRAAVHPAASSVG